MEPARTYQKVSTLRSVRKHGKISYYNLLKEEAKRENYEKGYIVKMGRRIKTEPIDERFVPQIEICCKRFGCGKILSMTEKLFGNLCINHQNKKRETPY